MRIPRLLSVGTITADFYTSPHPDATLDPEPAVLAAIEGATRSILFAMFSFTSKPIAAALTAAAGRGVPVTGVVDRGQAAQPYAATHALRWVPGIALRTWNGSGLMHDKAFIVDGGSRVGLGSYNWTAAAQKSNVEVLLIARSRFGAKLPAALTSQVMAAYNQGTPLSA